MNGVLMLSMDSGMLLYSQELQPSFGLSSPCDPFRQSGFLFALYASASAQFAPPSSSSSSSSGGSGGSSGTKGGPDSARRDPPLQWCTQDRVVWHFHEEQQEEEGEQRVVGGGKAAGARRVLTALSATADLSPASAQAIAAQLAQVSLLLTSPRPQINSKCNAYIYCIYIIYHMMRAGV